MSTEKTAIAARLYIALRREAKRSIDVEWLIVNDDYAREILALAKQYSPELIEIARRFEVLLPDQVDAAPPLAASLPNKVPPPPTDVSNRYIGRLR